MMARVGLERIGNPVLLMILSHQPDGTIASQRELADLLHVTPATVTVSLRALERNGYIQKLENESDLRRKPIAITEKGMQAVARIEEAFDRLDVGMYHGFSEEEKAMVSDLFDRMARNLLDIVDLSDDAVRPPMRK